MKDIELTVNKRSPKDISIVFVFALLVFVCLAGRVNAGCDPNILNVDFGLTGQALDTCWDSWEMGSGDELDPTDPNKTTWMTSDLGISGFVGVQIQLGVDNDATGVKIRNRSAELDAGHPQYNLLVDNIYNDNGAFTLSFFDLKKATYLITTYHADPGTKRNPINISIKDADNKNNCGNWRVISDVHQSMGTQIDQDPLTASFAFRSDGGQVTILFEDAGGADTAGPVLNGFEIERMVDEIKVDIGEDNTIYYYGQGYYNLTAPWSDKNSGITYSPDIDIPSDLGTSGSVNVALSSAKFNWRTNMELGDPGESFLNDYCYAGNLTLTLSGLKAGVYQINTYHNDPGIGHPPIDASINDEEMAVLVSQSLQVNSVSNCISRINMPFTVVSDNDIVEIGFTARPGTNSSVVLNGFELSQWQIFDQDLCGDPGFVYLSGDYNRDCRVGLPDILVLAGSWLNCSDPTDSNCDQYWQ